MLVNFGFATKYYDVIVVESMYFTQLFSTLILNAPFFWLFFFPEDNEFKQTPW